MANANADTVRELSRQLQRSDAVVVTGYQGLTAAQLATLRRELRPHGSYAVVRNTLARIAVHSGPMIPLLTGPTGLAFLRGDAADGVRALRRFAETHRELVVRGGMVEGHLLDRAELYALRSRTELLATTARLLAAPATHLVRLVDALSRKAS